MGPKIMSAQYTRFHQVLMSVASYASYDAHSIWNLDLAFCPRLIVNEQSAFDQIVTCLWFSSDDLEQIKQFIVYS